MQKSLGTLESRLLQPLRLIKRQEAPASSPGPRQRPEARMERRGWTHPKGWGCEPSQESLDLPWVGTGANPLAVGLGVSGALTGCSHSARRRPAGRRTCCS